MTPLRQKMIDAMQVRGFSARTHQSYLSAVSALAQYYHRTPERLSVDEIQAYFLYLVKERGLSGASCRLYLNAIRFLYLQVLKQTTFDVPFQIPKKAQRIPELLTRAEVGQILSAVRNTKHRVMLTTCYGCGLRVSELVALKVRHIDSERHLLRVEQGKGGKDRQVVLPETLLQQLRRYWRHYQPTLWLFPHGDTDVALAISTAQQVFTRAKSSAGIDKIGGIHSLRHAYATHQLEAGLPVHQLQQLLGHQDIRTTLRYVHWVPGYRAGEIGVDLIAALEVEHGGH
ncbi:MAG: site-specific integrase [Gammaproteobacteria bacterium]|nr:MAG: site-specific integrase [Gammaproteobacteria bacterium]